jgi:hypothetical protein
VEFHNKKGHLGFSTTTRGYGCIVNESQGLDSLHQKCEICNKTLLKRNFDTHLTSVGHKTKASRTGSDHQQSQQPIANSIPPQQQHNKSGIQSILDADRSLAIKYDVQLMEDVMTRDDFRTISSIPPILRRGAAAAKIKLLDDINKDPSNVSKHVLFIIFSKLVLTAMPYEVYWKTRMKDRKKKANSVYK